MPLLPHTGAGPLEPPTVWITLVYAKRRRREIAAASAWKASFCLERYVDGELTIDEYIAAVKKLD